MFSFPCGHIELILLFTSISCSSPYLDVLVSYLVSHDLERDGISIEIIQGNGLQTKVTYCSMSRCSERVSMYDQDAP